MSTTLFSFFREDAHTQVCPWWMQRLEMQLCYRSCHPSTNRHLLATRCPLYQATRVPQYRYPVLFDLILDRFINYLPLLEWLYEWWFSIAKSNSVPQFFCVGFGLLVVSLELLSDDLKTNKNWITHIYSIPSISNPHEAWFVKKISLSLVVCLPFLFSVFVCFMGLWMLS